MGKPVSRRGRPASSMIATTAARRFWAAAGSPAPDPSASPALPSPAKKTGRCQRRDPISRWAGLPGGFIRELTKFAEWRAPSGLPGSATCAIPIAGSQLRPKASEIRQFPRICRTASPPSSTGRTATCAACQNPVKPRLTGAPAPSYKLPTPAPPRRAQASARRTAPTAPAPRNGRRTDGGVAQLVRAAES